MYKQTGFKSIILTVTNNTLKLQFNRLLRAAQLTDRTVIYMQ